MTRIKYLNLRVLITFLVMIASVHAQTTYIHCGKLIDVTDGKVLNEMTIIIDNDRITAVEHGYLARPEGAKIISLRDMTVLPGLMDMHVHLEGVFSKESYTKKFTDNPADIAFNSVSNAQITLESGFTTVRDLGGTGVNISLRNAINSKKIIGPRIYTAGKALAITGGHADPTNGYRWDLMGNPGPEIGVINGVDDARKAVRTQYKKGADCIKITATGGVLSVAKDGTGPHFRLEEMKAIVEAATDLNMHVAAHAHGKEGMKRAVLAGVTSIEHGTFMDEEIMQLMITQGTWYVPTITAGKSVGDSALIKNYFPPIITPKALEVGPRIFATFETAFKRGVKIAFGTDAGVFQHGKNALEFQFMVEAGMKPMEAIQSATVNAAELLGVSAILGSITKGKIADIIAVKGNPTEDIAILSDVKFVMKEGKVYVQ